MIFFQLLPAKLALNIYSFLGQIVINKQNPLYINMEQHEVDSNYPNYSSSERKLKNITHQLPFNPPSTEQIQDKINKMRMKIALKNQTQKKPNTDNEDYGSELPKPRQKMYTQNTPQYNHITSLLSNRNSKVSIISRNNQSKYPSKLQVIRKPNIQAYKDQLVQRDKYKNPIKYKIIQEEIGISNDQRVFNLRKDQVNRIQEQFMKRKGLEYLREGNSAANKLQTQKFYSNNKGRTSSLNSKASKIHQIFNNPISQGKRMKSQKSLKGGKKGKRLLQDLKEKQQMLGKIVFQKVKKHLKDEKQDANYFRRVYSEQTIDDALVDFLRVKIERAQASLDK